MDFSIIIPVLNERSKIANDIEGAGEFLVEKYNNSEIIIVDDGSTDGSSAIARATKTPARVTLNVITHKQRCGKGHAVRKGVAAASGKHIMFADSGSCVPWHFIQAGTAYLETGAYQIANASRKLPDSRIIRPQSGSRRLNSYLFRIFLIVFMGIPKRFTDTQCGFKMYNGKIAKELYAACITDGFTFDVEILLRALKGGYKVVEFPIEWTADPDSRLGQTLSVTGILQELKAIRAAVG